MSNKRLLELDALRGIAALAVVFYHYLYRYDEIYKHENISVGWAKFGELGVELFFMVSGFVIFWTLNRVQRPFDFIVSRFSRLYPAYFVAAIASFSIISIFGLPGREISIQYAVLNLLMFHEYLKVPHIDGVYWTLTVELTFYFWIFILYILNKLHITEKLFATIVVLSVINSLGFIEIPSPFYRIFIMKHAAFFLAGIAFYNLINSDNKKQHALFIAIALLSTAVNYSLESFSAFLFLYIVFYLALIGKVQFLSGRLFIFLGSISYSLYLVHQNIGYIIINKSYEYQLHPLVGILIALSFSIVLANALTRYIELPALKWIRINYAKSQKLQKLSDWSLRLKKNGTRSSQ